MKEKMKEEMLDGIRQKSARLTNNVSLFEKVFVEKNFCLTETLSSRILCTGQNFAAKGERGKIELHRPTKGIAKEAMAKKEVRFDEAAAANRSEILSSTEK